MKWNDSDIYINNKSNSTKKKESTSCKKRGKKHRCMCATVAGVVWWAIFNGFAGEARWRSLQKWSGLNTDRQQVLKVNATN